MTDYEQFKAIADDIAEMYANGYAEYAEYFSETFSGIGELSAVTRISDKVYALRRTDVRNPAYTTTLKEIAIDAMLAIGEINIVPTNASELDEVPFLEPGARYWCKTTMVSHAFGFTSTPLKSGCIYKYLGGRKFKNENLGDCCIVDADEAELSEYLQKIFEKKS